MTPQALLFDMDGVLVDSFDVWIAVMNETARRVGAPAITAAQVRVTWGKGIEADRDIYYPGETLDRIEAEFARAFPASLPELNVMTGARRIFPRLRELGIRTSVITNTPRDVATMVLEHAGLEPNALVGSTDVEKSKPAPDMVIEACRRLDVEPARAVVVGDSIYDAGAALAAGVPFIGFRMPDVETTIEELEDLFERLDLT